MEKKIRNFIEDTKRIALTRQEKQVMDQAVFSMLDQETVRNSDHEHLNAQRSSVITHLRLLFLRPMTIALLLVILVSGGTSVFAHQALPGDALYPVKINVNETVSGWFAWSKEAEAQYEAELAARRLEEGQQLALEGRLTGDARAIVQTNVKEYTARANARVKELQDREEFRAAADISSQLESSLKAHSQVFIRLDVDTRQEAKPLVPDIQVQAETAAKARVENEERITANADAAMEVAAKHKRDAASKRLVEIRGLFESHRDSFEASFAARMNQQLTLAHTTIVQGERQLEAKAFGQAFTSFQEALRITQEARVLIQAEQALSVRANLQVPQKNTDDKADENEQEESQTIEEENETEQKEDNDEAAIDLELKGNTEVKVGL